jgi:hypothetical protein
MRERIWYEMIDSRYKVEYLVLHTDKLEKTNKSIDNILTLTSLAGIGGWFKFAEHNVLWASLLLLLTGFRLMKSKFLTTEQEISTLKSVYEFHVDHSRKLENLWLKYNSSKVNDDDAEIQFEKLRDEERMMSKIHKHGKIHEKDSISAKAKANTDDYIKKISN